MKKIDLGQTFTILANIGVIVGIAFLAFELAQNNALLENQVASEIEARRTSTIDVVLNNPSYVEILRKDEQSLTDLEREQLVLLGIRIFLNWENMHEDVLRGNVDEEYARRVIRSVYWRPSLNYGADVAWETFKGRGSAAFILWMEENVIQPGPP